MNEIKQLTPQLHGLEDELPERVTNDELYRRSTQFRFWSFTQDSLTDLRIRVNKKGESNFRARIDTLDSTNELNQEIKSYVTDTFQPLTVAEEREIIVYYARKCHDLSNFFKFSTQVRLTAVSYLSKFYLVHSVMEYYPQQIMYTCLYLSAKSENNFLGIKNFSNAIPKTTPESILQYEYLILDTMRFSLMCHHPMKPLYGFFLDIQNVLIKLDFARLCKDYEASRKLINESVFTDVQFLYTPSQIALAALYIVDDVVCMRYLMRKFGVKRKQMVEMMEEREKVKVEVDVEDTPVAEGSVPAPEVVENDNVVKEQVVEKSPLIQFNKIMDYVKKCAEMMQNIVDPSLQTAKTISLKAHFCLDPDKYFKKINKPVVQQPTDAITSVDNADVEVVEVDVGVKRELETVAGDETQTKRVKVE